MPALYDLFLSYNTADRPSADVLRVALQQRGVQQFMDYLCLPPGQSWMDQLDGALGESAAVAVLIGPSGLGRWQRREVSWALDRQSALEARGGALPVIPVLLPGADLERAGGFLLLMTWIDLRAGLDNAQALDRLTAALRANPVPPAPADGAAVSPPAALCPYRGLRAFHEEDGPLYFGREDFIKQLTDKVDQGGLIAVVGPSGSGKSSVVQAGLLPRLRRRKPPARTWDAVILTPGAQPMLAFAAAIAALLDPDKDNARRLLDASELAGKLLSGELLATTLIAQVQAMPRAPERLLLIIDQFEELFTISKSEKEQQRFIHTLLDCAAFAGATVILTLRADFYGRAIGASRDLSDLIQRGVVNLGPMRRAELKSAIIEPARRVGVSIEPALVEHILDRLDEQPGHLPLLEFTLAELYSHRAGNHIGAAQYDAIGGVKGAIASRAEAIFTNRPPAEQDAGLRALTRLVRVAAGGEEGSDTRQRVTRAALPAASLPLVDAFVNERLLVSDRDAAGLETVEVAHEALLKGWPRLHSWVDTDRSFLLFRQRLSAQVSEWQAHPEDPSLLLAGHRLDEAKRWRKEREPELSHTESAFIAKSLRKQRSELRLRWVVGAAVAAIVSIAVLGTGAWVAWTRTDRYQVEEILRDFHLDLEVVEENQRDRYIDSLIAVDQVGKARELAGKIKAGSRKGGALAHIARRLAERGRKAEAVEQLEAVLTSASDADFYGSLNLESGLMRQLIVAATAIAAASPSDYASLGPLLKPLRNPARAFDGSRVLEEMAHSVTSGAEELTSDAIQRARSLSSTSEKLARLSEIASYWHTGHRDDLAARALQDTSPLFLDVVRTGLSDDFFYVATLARVGHLKEALVAFKTSMARQHGMWTSRQEWSIRQLSTQLSRAGRTDDLLAAVPDKEADYETYSLLQMALGVSSGAPGRETNVIALLARLPYGQVEAWTSIASDGSELIDRPELENAQRWGDPSIVPEEVRRRAATHLLQASTQLLTKVRSGGGVPSFAEEIPIALAINDELDTGIGFILQVPLSEQTREDLLAKIVLAGIRRGRALQVSKLLKAAGSRGEVLRCWLSIAENGLVTGDLPLADSARAEVLKILSAPYDRATLSIEVLRPPIDLSVSHGRPDWAYELLRTVRDSSLECTWWTAQVRQALETADGYPLASSIAGKIIDKVCLSEVRASIAQKLVKLERPKDAEQQLAQIVYPADKWRATQALSLYYAQHGQLRRARLLANSIDDSTRKMAALASILLAAGKKMSTR
jgi:hypothetical protein